MRELDLEIYRGEFVCIIGDVGSGKSSLLNSVIGDLIYISDDQIADFGGMQKTASDEDFERLKKTCLSAEHSEAPIQIKGSISYVE